jgi:hypothetical protein
LRSTPTRFGLGFGHRNESGRADIDRTGAQLHRSGERRFDLFFGASVDNYHHQPEAWPPPSAR